MNVGKNLILFAKSTKKKQWHFMLLIFTLIAIICLYDGEASALAILDVTAWSDTSVSDSSASISNVFEHHAHIVMGLGSEIVQGGEPEIFADVGGLHIKNNREGIIGISNLYALQEYYDVDTAGTVTFLTTVNYHVLMDTSVLGESVSLSMLFYNGINTLGGSSFNISYVNTTGSFTHYAYDFTQSYYETMYFSDGDGFITLAGAEIAAFVSSSPAPVPEPSTLLLLGIGLAGFAGFRKLNTSTSQSG